MPIPAWIHSPAWNTAQATLDEVGQAAKLQPLIDKVESAVDAANDTVSQHGWPVAGAIAGGVGGAALAAGSLPLTASVGVAMLASIGWGAGKGVNALSGDTPDQWKEIAGESMWNAAAHLAPGVAAVAMPMSSYLSPLFRLGGAFSFGTLVHTSTNAYHAAISGDSVHESLQRDSRVGSLLAHGADGLLGLLPAGAGHAVAVAAPRQALSELMANLPSFNVEREALTLLAARAYNHTGAHGFSHLGHQFVGQAYQKLVDLADRNLFSLIRLLQPMREQLSNKELSHFLMELESHLKHRNPEAFAAALGEMARNEGMKVPTRLYNQIKTVATDAGDMVAGIVDFGERAGRVIKDAAVDSVDEAMDSAASVVSEAGRTLGEMARDEMIRAHFMLQWQKEQFSSIARDGLQKAAEMVGLRTAPGSQAWRIDPPQLGNMVTTDATHDEIQAELAKRLPQRDDLETMTGLFLRTYDFDVAHQFSQAVKAMDGYIVELKNRLSRP